MKAPTQFLTNDKGEKIAVVISMVGFPVNVGLCLFKECWI